MAEVTLTVVGNELEADVLCGLLRTNGIACTYRITDLAAGMADASFSKAGPREILVEASQLDAARKLLPHSQ